MRSFGRGLRFNDLRLVPTKCKSFVSRLGPGAKSTSLQVLLEFKKKNLGIAKHFLNLNKNGDIGIFLKKKRKDVSSQISLKFAFT